MSPSCRWAMLLVALSAASCATDELALAPTAPSRPWVIPPPSAPLPLPGTVPADIPTGDTGHAPPPTAPDATTATQPDAAGPMSTVPIDATRRYDLAELIDLAQRNNPETRDAWEKARQAALSVGLSETSFVPQIAAEIIGGYQHTPLPITTNVVPSGIFTSDTAELIPALTAKWLLFDFGQRASAVTAARANSFVANVSFTGAHQKLIYAVSRDYFALGAARGRLRVAEQALKMALVVEDASNARRKRGLATVMELAQSQRQTAQARFTLTQATGAEHNAYSALIASIGIAPRDHLAPRDSSELALPSEKSGDVDRLVQDALANRPDIIAALGKVRAAEAGVEGARATYYPTVGLETQVYQNIGALSAQGGPYRSINEPGASVLLKLSLPLFDGGARDARVALARSEVEAARDAAEQAKIGATRQVTDAYDSLKTSFAEYAAALVLNEAAQTAYDAALDAFRHGVGTYTDVVSEETALSQAQSKQEDAHANVLTAAAALAFATGAMPAQQ